MTKILRFEVSAGKLEYDIDPKTGIGSYYENSKIDTFFSTLEDALTFYVQVIGYDWHRIEAVIRIEDKEQRIELSINQDIIHYYANLVANSNTILDI